MGGDDLDLPPDLSARILREGGPEIVLLSFTPRGDAGLSEAEARVAMAVARGQSNAEIARDQGVAARTVANQVASILRKLDVSNRAEVAAIFGITHLR